MFRLCMLLLVVISIIGCSTNSIRSDFRFDENAQGVAVFSVSNNKIAGKGRAAAIFYMNGEATEENYRQLESTEKGFLGGGVEDSEFSDVQGRLFAITLPAGDHELTSWKIFNGAGVHIRPRNEPTPLKFHMGNGEIKYLGNFHINIQMGKNIFGMKMIGGGWPEIRDEGVRDIAIFEERYPQFKGMVVNEVLKTGLWIGEGENK